MKILVYLKGWNGFGGGEQSIRTLMEGLESLGHEYDVVCGDAMSNPRFHVPAGDLVGQFRSIGPDVVFTQLKWSPNLKPIARKIGVPIVQFVRCGIPPHPGMIHLFNSKWNRARHGGKGEVIYPPIDFDMCRTSMNPANRRYVTMMSTSHHKGGDLLRRFAAAMPKVQFLGITGFGGTQVHKFGKHPNITLQKKVRPRDVHTIYEKTRIMILPARHESFGRTVAEAVYNRIPVIASNKPGVVEAGGASVEIVRDLTDMRSWKEKIMRRHKDDFMLPEGSRKHVMQFEKSHVIGKLDEWIRKTFGG